MGWTTTTKYSWETMDEFFEREFGNIFIGKGAFVRLSRYYRIFENNNGYYILCCLVHLNKDKQFNISYKDMDETEIPYIYDCPKRILKEADRLSSSNLSPKARKYRDLCYEYHRKQSLIKNNALIKFSMPIEFYSGAISQYFVVGKKKQLYIYDIDRKRVGAPCNIIGWRDRDYEVISTDYHTI